MNVNPDELSRLRAWAVNTPAFRQLSPRERKRMRVALGDDPSEWPPEAEVFVRMGRRLFGD